MREEHVGEAPEVPSLQPLAPAARLALLRGDGAADVRVLGPRDVQRRVAACAATKRHGAFKVRLERRSVGRACS